MTANDGATANASATAAALPGLEQPGRTRRESAALHWEYGKGNGHGEIEERSFGKTRLRMTAYQGRRRRGMTAYGYGVKSEEMSFGKLGLPGLWRPGCKVGAG
jgi:hypothetical protein